MSLGGRSAGRKPREEFVCDPLGQARADAWRRSRLQHPSSALVASWLFYNLPGRSASPCHSLSQVGSVTATLRLASPARPAKQ